MQLVTFKDGQSLQNVVNNPMTKKTTLTQWLHNNQVDDRGRHLTYLDYLSNYKWDANGKDWECRTTKRTPAIGRLIYIHPTCGEVFYLRMLLTHQRGCQTFADIRTVGGVVFPTYRSACQELGLLGDDNEWTYAFDEAATWASAEELRSLFAHMLLFCEVSDPVSLWTKHWRRMSDDIGQRAAADSRVVNLHVNDEDLQHYILYELEIVLNSNCNSSSLSEYGLLMPPPHLLAEMKNRLLMEERNYDRVALADEHKLLVSDLNSRQKLIYESVMEASLEHRQELIFVYGHGGTGKTFLWKTIISALRSAGKIVLAVASSGIASLLLPSGRTAHSWFKIPLDITNDSVEMDCKTMITRLGFSDPCTLPVPLVELRGKIKIFQMRFSGSSKKGAVDFVVDNVFEDTIPPQTDTETEQSTNAAPATPTETEQSTNASPAIRLNAFINQLLTEAFFLHQRKLRSKSIVTVYLTRKPKDQLLWVTRPRNRITKARIFWVYFFGCSEFVKQQCK